MAAVLDGYGSILGDIKEKTFLNVDTFMCSQKFLIDNPTFAIYFYRIIYIFLLCSRQGALYISSLYMLKFIFIYRFY